MTITAARHARADADPPPQWGYERPRDVSIIFPEDQITRDYDRGWDTVVTRDPCDLPQRTDETGRVHHGDGCHYLKVRGQAIGEHRRTPFPLLSRRPINRTSSPTKGDRDASGGPIY